MYEAVKDVVFYFVNPAYTKADDTYEVGYQIGAFFYYLLVPNSVY